MALNSEDKWRKEAKELTEKAIYRRKVSIYTFSFYLYVIYRKWRSG